MTLFEKMLSNDYKIHRYNYNEGKIVFHEKDYCDKLGFVLEGELKLVHYSYEGKAIILGALKKGDFFGDFLIFSSHPYYPGDLISVTKTKIAMIKRDDLIKYLQEDSKLQEFYLQQLSEKALTLNMHNKLLGLPTLRERIILYLENYSTKTEKKKVYTPSKTDLAMYLNVQRPSLSRELKNMKDEGIIDYDRNYIWFLNP